MIIGSDLAETLTSGFYGIQNLVAKKYDLEVGNRFWQRHLTLEREFNDWLRGKVSEGYYWHETLRGTGWPHSLTATECRRLLSQNMRAKVPGTLSVYRRIISHPYSFSEPWRRLKIPPDQMIFIDDNPKNVAAAERYGIETILFVDAEQLEEELKNYGFEFAPTEEDAVSLAVGTSTMSLSEPEVDVPAAAQEEARV